MKEAISIPNAQTRLQTSRVRDRVGARVTSFLSLPFHVILLFAPFVTYRNSRPSVLLFHSILSQLSAFARWCVSLSTGAPAPPNPLTFRREKAFLRLISLVTDENGMLNELALKIDKHSQTTKLFVAIKKSRICMKMSLNLHTLLDPSGDDAVESESPPRHDGGTTGSIHLTSLWPAS